MIVPPNTTDEEFDLKWEKISSSMNAFPVEYVLTAREEELDTPLLPMVCHRVKVQRCIYILYSYTTIKHVSS